MEKINYTSQVESYLTDLVDTLFAKEYFGFKASAYDYVNELILRIEETINFKVDKSVPYNLRFFGSKYICFNTNPRTTWYVFFNRLNSEITITFIFNNHEKFAQYLDL